MKMKKALLPILLVLALLLGAAGGAWMVYSSGLRMTVVERYETGYDQPVLVYELVKKINRRENVRLTLSGKGDIQEDGQSITFSKAGSYTVVVRAEEGMHSAEETTTIVVKDEKPPLLSAENFSIILGEVPNYLAHIKAEDDMDGDLASMVRIDSSKVVLEEPGRYEVNYTVLDSSGNAAAAMAYLTISRAPASDIQLDEKEFWLSGNEYNQLNAVVEPRDWEGTVQWESSDESVCIVHDGLVVWKGAGQCVITATADNTSAECIVHCGDPALTTVWLNQRTLDLDEYQSARLTCQTYPSNWGGSIKWSTSNPSVATVEDGVVSWVGPGSCTIIASHDGVADRCEVSCAGKTWSDLFWDLLNPTSEDYEEGHHGRERSLDEIPSAG